MKKRRAKTFVAIDIGHRNFGIDIYTPRKHKHKLVLLDLLVTKDASGKWYKIKMEERLVHDFCYRLVDAFAKDIKKATMVGIEGQMKRGMAVFAAVLQATIEQRYPHVTVVKLSPRCVRAHMSKVLKVPLSGSERSYKESKDAAKHAVCKMLGRENWTKYVSKFKRTIMMKKSKKTEIRIDPGDAMLMAVYMRDNQDALEKNRVRAPSRLKRKLAPDETKIARTLKLSVPGV